MDLNFNLVVMSGLSLICVKLSTTQKTGLVFFNFFFFILGVLLLGKIYVFLQIFTETFYFNKDLFTTLSESKYVPVIKCISLKYM